MFEGFVGVVEDDSGRVTTLVVDGSVDFSVLFRVEDAMAVAVDGDAEVVSVVAVVIGVVGAVVAAGAVAFVTSGVPDVAVLLLLVTGGFGVVV